MILIFFSSFFCSAIFTMLLTKFLPVLNIVDHPGGRKAHKNIVPRGGGIGIVFSFMIFYSQALICFNVDINLYGISLPFLLMGLLSLIDDTYSLNVGVRLYIHILLSFWIVYLFLHPNHMLFGELGLTGDLIASTIFIVSFCNIYNFMDGIDGITSLNTIFILSIIVVMTFLENVIYADLIKALALLIISSSIGFLIFNFPPAKIFLGDIGSTFLGIIVATCITFVAASSMKLMIAMVIANGYYLCDGVLTILKRFFRGEKVWMPHLEHCFQKACKNGLSHLEVNKIVLKCNFMLGILCFMSLKFPVISFSLAIVVLTKTVVTLTEK